MASTTALILAMVASSSISHRVCLMPSSAVRSAIGFAVDNFLNRGEERRSPGAGYMITYLVLEVFLGILASTIVAWYSRQREFRADAGSGDLMGQRQSMIQALRRLGGLQAGELPNGLQSMGITGSIGKLFATHPPIEERIARLQQAQAGR